MSRHRRKPNKDKQPKGKAPFRELSSLVTYSPTTTPFVNYWRDNRHEQVNTFKHWVYIAIDRIASKIATQIPNVSYLTTTDKKISERQRRKALTPLLSYQTLKNCEDNHPLVRLLRDPNEPDTSYDLFYETILFLGLTGNAYWWVPKNKLGVPSAIWVVPSHWMWPIIGKNKFYEAWELRPTEGNYMRRTIPAEEIIHFRYKSPLSKIDGFSKLTAGNQWIDVQDSVNRSKHQAYKNGSFPTVAVQFDGSLNDPSDEQLRRIEQKFIARYVGEMNSNRPLFLPPGVKVAPLTIEPNKMVFGDTAQETRDNILALFGVPALIAGIMEGMTYGSIGAAQAGFCSLTLAPLCYFLGQVMTEKLAWEFDENLKIWWDDFTPDDPAQTDREIKTSLMAGAISPNEIRILQGREPWPDKWADEPFMPVSMQPLTTSQGGEHQDPESKPKKPKPEDPKLADESDKERD